MIPETLLILPYNRCVSNRASFKTEVTGRER